jgi:flagellar motor switch protein FliM
LPHRLSKNQLRTFQAVHEGFGETFSSYLVSRLQTSVSIAVASVDQLFYSEYVLSITSPSSFYVFRILESDALAVLEVSPPLLLAMVEHLMGGVAEGEKTARPITKIEQSIVRGIIQYALSDVQRAWKTVAELTFKFERYEMEGDFVQIAPSSEIVMVVSFDVTVGTQKYQMSLCFPTFALEKVLAKLNMQHFSGMTPSKEQGDKQSLVMRQIGETAVETVAVLGRRRSRCGAALEPGDILRSNIPHGRCAGTDRRKDPRAGPAGDFQRQNGGQGFKSSSGTVIRSIDGNARIGFSGNAAHVPRNGRRIRGQHRRSPRGCAECTVPVAGSIGRYRRATRPQARPADGPDTACRH